MPDEIDRAQAQEEQLTAIAQRFRKPEGPKATGVCLWCHDPVNPGIRWCSAGCRDDFEKAGGV